MLFHCMRDIMMRNHKVTLVTKYKQNGSATTISEQTTEIWADVKSVTRTEFYQAYSSNLKPKNIIDVLPSEYKKAIVTIENGPTYEPTRIIVDGTERNIIRVFTKNDYSMEITVG